MTVPEEWVFTAQQAVEDYWGGQSNAMYAEMEAVVAAVEPLIRARALQEFRNANREASRPSAVDVPVPADYLREPAGSTETVSWNEMLRVDERIPDYLKPPER